MLTLDLNIDKARWKKGDNRPHGFLVSFKKCFLCGGHCSQFGAKTKVCKKCRARETDCVFCGKKIKQYTASVYEERLSCSKSCIMKYKVLHNIKRDKLNDYVKNHPRKGKDCHFWSGGTSTPDMKRRNRIEYLNWRKSVFSRDNYTCVFCGVRGGKLEADHIKPFLFYPELEIEVSNGRTLCKECHKKTETYGGKIKRFKNKKQFENFEKEVSLN